jgi:hypothetical protein
VTVELLERGGGHNQWALLGGSYMPMDGAELQASIWYSGPMSLAGETRCEGPLGRTMLRGLPVDLLDGVVAGLSRESNWIRPGSLVIRQAAYDRVDSSIRAFANTSQLLAWALLAAALDVLTAAALVAKIATLPD